MSEEQDPGDLNSLRATRISFMISLLVEIQFLTNHVGSIFTNLKKVGYDKTLQRRWGDTVS